MFSNNVFITYGKDSITFFASWDLSCFGWATFLKTTLAWMSCKCVHRHSGMSRFSCMPSNTLFTVMLKCNVPAICSLNNEIGW